MEVLGTSPGQGPCVGTGLQTSTPLIQIPTLATCDECRSSVPTLTVFGRFPQGAPLLRGRRKVPGVPGLGVGDCPAARPRRCVCRAGPAAAARCCLARGEAAG